MKKAYIFLMDGIFAVILLVIGLIIVSSNRVNEYSETPLAVTLDNSLSLLSSVKVSDICQGCNCSIKKIGELCLAGDIKNERQSLLDLMGELYSRNRNMGAYLILKNITDEKDIFRENELFGAEIDINNARIYPNSTSIGKDKSKNLLSSKRLIFGYYENPEDGTITYWGPYEVRAELWEKQ
jgi:hypothetical protein